MIEFDTVISGDSDKVKLAESIINLQTQVSKLQITSQTHQLHSKYILLLADIPLFQIVLSKHAMNLVSWLQVSQWFFFSIVAALFIKPDAMKLDTSIDYLLLCLS